MTATRTISCVLGCRSPDGHPWPAAEGYMTCDKCGAALWSTLQQIASDYAELVGDVDHLLPAPGGSGHRAPGFASSVPVNLHVIAMTDHRAGLDGDRALSAPGVLGMWVRTIVEDTGAQWPTTTVPTMVDWLLVRWNWVTRQPWVDVFAEESRELACALDRQLRPRPPSVPIGRCAVVVDGTPCGTPLRVRPGDTAIRCRGCDTDWPRKRWAELGQRWFDYAMLVELFKVPNGTLRRWCAEDNWTRSGSEGRPLWAHADVLASWQRRHGQTQEAAS